MPRTAMPLFRFPRNVEWDGTFTITWPDGRVEVADEAELDRLIGTSELFQADADGHLACARVVQNFVRV